MRRARYKPERCPPSMLPAVDASGWIARAERTVYDNRWVRLGLWM